MKGDALTTKLDTPYYLYHSISCIILINSCISSSFIGYVCLKNFIILLFLLTSQLRSFNIL